MSFSREEVLEEFEEAAELGRNHRQQVATQLAQRWWREEGFKTLRPPVPPLEPIPPLAVRDCPTCGAVVELRPGTRKAVHLGPFTSCERKSA